MSVRFLTSLNLGNLFEPKLKVEYNRKSVTEQLPLKRSQQWSISRHDDKEKIFAKFP